MRLNLLNPKKHHVTIFKNHTMKTIKFFAFALFVFLSGLAISSCSGDDGATGPAGADGQDGNANVIFSDWIVPTWSAGSFYGVQVQEYNINTTNLTQDVVDNGVVLMYWKNFNDDVWQLPSSGLGGNLIIDFSFSENTLHLYVFDEINGTLPPALGNPNVFRYVIIPGNIPGKTFLDSREEIITILETAGVDTGDYHDVCNYYGIYP